MQQIIMTAGNHPPVALAGTVLTVDGHAIDLAQRQQDVATIIDLSLGTDGAIVEGKGQGWYAANIVIPPATYTEVDTGTKDADGNPIIGRQKNALNTDLVTINLWALPTETQGAQA